jgi:mono/diheme cytochrome c family protein
VIALIAIVSLSTYGQITTMIKQAAAPASPPESQVLAAAPAAAAETSTSGGGGSAGAAAGGAGASVFTQNCSSCHGANGMGTPGAFPPLANNPVVTGDANKVIGIVLNGLHGSISVSGQTYNGQMPPWKGTLSNKDVADVITYIRGSLGNNKASAVTEAQVAGYKP